MAGTDKITRILILFNRLNKGEYINKSEFSIEHNIAERSFDRDIEDIRIFLNEIYTNNELLFDKTFNAYYLSESHKIEISGVETLALFKILISSRAFRQDEIIGIISSIEPLISSDNKKHVLQLMYNEINNYVSLTHNKAILKMQWDLGQCILKQQKIELLYCRADGNQIKRLVSPISIIFSEFYFYLIAFRDDKNYNYPAFFRLDRIESFKITNTQYPYSLYEKFNTGKMKNCIQFMYAGELINVKLKCSKNALESVLDRLPNAKIIEESDKITLEAKIFGDGFARWVLSQGDSVEILEPKQLMYSVKLEAQKIINLYSK